MQIIGKYGPALRQKQLISIINGMMMNGCKSVKSIMTLTHHGVYTKYIWQVGCGPIPFSETSLNSYREQAKLLVPYVKKMGFTHVEFMPVMEYPFDGSWGYQGTGYFAPTSRFGIPEEFMEMIEAFHNEDIGVILDWVPSHFPYDAFGLFMFDGTHTYEYADMRKGFHPDWNSYIFNYKKGRSKIVSYQQRKILVR